MDLIIRQRVKASHSGRDLPLPVVRALRKLGHDIRDARRRRRIPVAVASERASISKTTWLKVEKGDPSVSMGVYAMALFVLGFGDVFAGLVDAKSDEDGLLFDAERVPKRVRAKKGSPAL